MGIQPPVRDEGGAGLAPVATGLIS